MRSQRGIKDLEPLVGLQPRILATWRATRQVHFFGDAMSRNAIRGLGGSRTAARVCLVRRASESFGSAARHEYFLLVLLRGYIRGAELLRANGIEAAECPGCRGNGRRKSSPEDNSRAEPPRRSASPCRGCPRTSLSAVGVYLPSYDRLLLVEAASRGRSMLAGTGRPSWSRDGVRQTRVAAVERALEAHFGGDRPGSTRNPRPNQQPPIRLENRPITHPFEIVGITLRLPELPRGGPNSGAFSVFFLLSSACAGQMPGTAWS